jgi:hypothetical protein
MTKHHTLLIAILLTTMPAWAALFPPGASFNLEPDANQSGVPTSEGFPPGKCGMAVLPPAKFEGGLSGALLISQSVAMESSAEMARSTPQPWSVSEAARSSSLEQENALAALGLTPEILTLNSLPPPASTTMRALVPTQLWVGLLECLGLLLIGAGLWLGAFRWHRGELQKRAWLRAVKPAACPAPSAARSQ